MIRFSKPCGECGGTGWITPAPHGFASRDCPNFYDICRCDSEPCLSCVGGWLPDDETVEAMAPGIFHDFLEPFPEAWAEADDDIKHWYRAVATRGLVAAARYQSETGEGE